MRQNLAKKATDVYTSSLAKKIDLIGLKADVVKLDKNKLKSFLLDP